MYFALHAGAPARTRTPQRAAATPGRRGARGPRYIYFCGIRAACWVSRSLPSSIVHFRKTVLRFVFSPVITPLCTRLKTHISREETGSSYLKRRSQAERGQRTPSRQGQGPRAHGSAAVPALGFAPVDPPAHRRHRTAQRDRSGTRCGGRRGGGRRGHGSGRRGRSGSGSGFALRNKVGERSDIRRLVGDDHHRRVDCVS